MKKAVITLILFDLLMIDVIALSLVSKSMVRYALNVIPTCIVGIRISWAVFILWFFWPYAKKAINYLINHRND